MAAFLTVCLNPVLQKTVVLPHLWENEVNRSSEHYFDASGKGVNVSRVLTQLGEKVIHLSHAGGVNRNLFLKKCAEDGLIIEHADSFSEIRFCYTLLNREKGSTTEIVEEALPVSPSTEEKIFNKYLQLLPASTVVIISGTKADGYSRNLYPSMVKEAKKSGKTVILDIKGSDLIESLAYSPDFIKPNFTEFISTFFPGKTARENEPEDSLLPEIIKKCRNIYADHGCQTILTRGAYGTLYFDGEQLKTITFEKLLPLNSTGCGDAFTAGFASVISKKTDIPLGINMGHRCAGKNARLVNPGTIR